MRCSSISASKTHLVKLAAVLAAATSGAALVPAGAHAGVYDFTTLDNASDPTFNQLLGINNRDVISGYFGSGAAGHPNQGYVLTRLRSYTSENFPNSVQTQVTGLNNTGTTVGFFSNTNLGVGSDANFGFVDARGKFRPVVDPNTPNIAVPTNQLLGVNDRNIAVGFYVDANGNSHGYTYNIRNSSFSPDINATGATSTTTAAINDRGVIAGFDTVSGMTEGFIDQRGHFKQFEVPGATSTSFFGLNDEGVAVGDYVNAAGDTEGLVYNSINGRWFTLNDPLAAAPGGTTLNGINDKGDIVGFYVDAAGNTDGLLARDPPPGPIAMSAMAGAPAMGSAVPEPSTWAMMLLGFCGLGFAAMRKRKASLAWIEL